jgi:hypothetical protein
MFCTSLSSLLSSPSFRNTISTIVMYSEGFQEESVQGDGGGG